MYKNHSKILFITAKDKCSFNTKLNNNGKRKKFTRNLNR